MSTPSGALLSRGVSIKGSVKLVNSLLIDGEVEGTIDSTGTLTIGEHARICGGIKQRKFYSRSRDAVIRVYDESATVIETPAHAGTPGQAIPMK
jgi:hypothetical protein